jgi:dTDP-4-dehydrorhamnose reductase
MNEVLITGAHGLLGKHLLPLLNFKYYAPTINELDITQIKWPLKYDFILHLAAYTDVSGAELNKSECYKTNVFGTENIVKNAQCPVIYISTDYIFDGELGNYPEFATPSPVNYYAFTKFCGELLVHDDNNLIIRTSFKPEKWEYPSAFIDQFTSADYVDVIAKEIAFCINNFESINSKINVLHIATERKSVYDLASRRNKVGKLSVRDVLVKLPEDVSLDTTLWQNLKKKINET